MEEIRKTVKSLLTSDEYMVISCLYGLEDKIGRPVSEVSDFLKIPKDKIISLKKKAIRKLAKSPMMRSFAEVGAIF